MTHLREAIGLLDEPERRVAAQWQLGRALYWAGDEEEGIALLEEAGFAAEAETVAD